MILNTSDACDPDFGSLAKFTLDNPKMTHSFAGVKPGTKNSIAIKTPS